MCCVLCAVCLLLCVVFVVDGSAPVHAARGHGLLPAWHLWHQHATNVWRGLARLHPPPGGDLEGDRRPLDTGMGGPAAEPQGMEPRWRVCRIARAVCAQRPHCPLERGDGRSVSHNQKGPPDIAPSAKEEDPSHLVALLAVSAVGNVLRSAILWPSRKGQ